MINLQVSKSRFSVQRLRLLSQAPAEFPVRHHYTLRSPLGGHSFAFSFFVSATACCDCVVPTRKWNNCGNISRNVSKCETFYFPADSWLSSRTFWNYWPSSPKAFYGLEVEFTNLEIQRYTTLWIQLRAKLRQVWNMGRSDRYRCLTDWPGFPLTHVRTRTHTRPYTHPHKQNKSGTVRRTQRKWSELSFSANSVDIWHVCTRALNVYIKLAFENENSPWGKKYVQ